MDNVQIWILICITVFLATAGEPALAQSQNGEVGESSFSWSQLFEPFSENLGSLILTVIAILLAYHALRANTALDKERLEFEKMKFKAEESEREKLVKFREQEYKRFSQPAADLAEHLADILTENPHWAHRALESAKLLPYSDTLFDERSQHFRAEKEELAARFTPYLLHRCKKIILSEDRDVYVLIDAGSTLYPFFEIIGKETAKRCHDEESWLQRFHLATNNLPGIQELIKSGRRTPWDRYSSLAIDDCRLLPGIPVPIFAAVAGDLTNETIKNLRLEATQNGRRATFIALIVGNWIRIRGSLPRCPVPMARGKEHCDVKQTLVNNADEIYVVTPLGKVFADCSNTEVNNALGFSSDSQDQELAPYEEVEINNKQAATVRIITTTRVQGRILYRHSNRVEDTLSKGPRHPEVTEVEFASRPLSELPHLFFPFDKLPASEIEEFNVEFPHYHTRTNPRLLEMFGAEEP